MDNTTYSYVNNETDDSRWSPVEQNCRPNWPTWTCIVANLAGFASTGLWFLVLLPQIWKNFRRKSVRGLSIAWATANFTAALINVFFVFMVAKIPLYGKISSVYHPIMEFILLIQFGLYGNYTRCQQVAYITLCSLLWGTVIALELTLNIGGELEYIAIFLWSTETFPQLVLNMKLHSTSGLSTKSVIIAATGKTTDFVATNGLVMPLQYIIMRYFSSAVGYINSMHVAWYLGNGKNVVSGGCSKQSQSTSDDSDDTNAEQMSLKVADNAANADKVVNADTPLRPNASDDDSTDVEITSEAKRIRPMIPLRIMILFFLTSVQVGFVIGFVWNIGTYFGIFAPVGIISFLTIAKIYLVKCKPAHDQNTNISNNGSD